MVSSARQEWAAIRTLAELAIARTARFRAFDPNEPRDPHGRWTDGGGSEDGEGSEPAPKPHGIEGLPKDAKIKDRGLQLAIDRGAFDITAKPSHGQNYELTITAKTPDHVRSTTDKFGRSTYYDPRYADLKTVDAGTEFERQVPKPKEGVSDQIAPLDRPDVIYRGMSDEEHAHYLKTGEIKSRGEYNIGEAQQGLTYWTTKPDTAAYYASSFAPWQFQPTFEHPAWVVAATRPKEVRDVPGTAENEVGVARPIKKDEVIGEWRGDAYYHKPGRFDLRPIGYDSNEYQLGGYAAPTTAVVWNKSGGEGGGGGTGEHPGPGYSKEAYVKDGVIHTGNVHDAARALYENRKVELTQPSQVSTLIHELGRVAQQMKAQGQKAPVFNLCNVTVKDTNLFCAESIGIPRVQMPQIPDTQAAAFRQYLADKCYKVEEGQEYAAHLRATQSELNGAKVAGIMNAMATKPKIMDRRIFVSQDDYILDGHHTW